MEGICNVCGKTLDIKNLRMCGSKGFYKKENGIEYWVNTDPIYECKYCICESIRDEFDGQGSDIKILV